jgi:peroxiredoxin
LTVVKDDGDGLNRDIQDLNQIYNDFILKNFSSAGNKGRKELLDAFIKETDAKFTGVQNSYFKDYLRYKIAAIEQFMRIKSRETLGHEYLAGKPILYDNVEYMDFFNVFFEKYLLINNKYLSTSDIYGMIKVKVTAGAFLDSLKRDPVLADRALREMVFLSGLKEMYYSLGIDKTSVLGLLEQVRGSSTYPRNQEIASDLINRLNHLAFGTKAPDFRLKDSSGQTVALEDLKGKPVYLYFFISNSPSCDAESEDLSGLFLKYRSKVHFIGISTDLSNADFQKFIKTKNYPWPVYWEGDQTELLESYDATTFPLFVLIDMNGNILRYPAPRPSEDIEMVLENL